MVGWRKQWRGAIINHIVFSLTVLVEEKNTHCLLCGQYLELPKDLPCKHTFCRACLQKHCLKHALEDRFPCPECQGMIKIDDPNLPIIEWADTIPTNEEIEKRLQAARQIEKEKKRKYCAICRVKWKKETATKYCKACQEYFCDECGNQHWLLRKSKQHRVWYIEDLEEVEKDPLLRSSLDLIFNAKLTHKSNLSKATSENDADQENCMITGATFLPDGELIFVDKTNQKLKYFDKHHRFVSSIAIQCFDVLAFNKSFIVASCPLQNQLITLSISDSHFDRKSVVDLEDRCYGLCHMNEGNNDTTFAVTLFSKPVKLLLYTGTKQTNSINIDSGSIIMCCPSYIAYIKQEKMFVLLDDTHACVKCVNQDGVIVWEKRIKNCRGLAVIDDNQILLGRSDRKTIDLVDKGGKILKSVVSDTDGVSNINCLSKDYWQLSRNTTRLLVGDNTNLVRVFLLEDPLKDDDIKIYMRRMPNTVSPSLSINSSEPDPNIRPKVCTIL